MADVDLGRRVLIGAGWLLMLAFLVAGAVGYVRWDNRQQARERAEEAATVAKINRVCGDLPVRVRHHGSSWSRDPYWEVTCRDGRVAVVIEP